MTIKLNVACGGNIFPGWENVDLVDMEDAYLRHLRGLDLSQMGGWPADQIALSRAITEGRVKFWRHDLRHGFGMFADGTVDAIYIGQAVEHLNPHSELPALFKECWRLLRSGGRVRITTPDIDKLINAFLAGAMDDFTAEQPGWYARLSAAGKLSAIMFGAGGPGCTRENYEGHFACWSAEDLIAELGSYGLPAHRAEQPSELFTECKDYGLSHSMALEAVKP